MSDQDSASPAAELGTVLEANLPQGQLSRLPRILPYPPRARLPQPVDPSFPPVQDPDPDTAGFLQVEEEARRLRGAVDDLVRREDQLVQQEMEQQSRVNPSIVSTIRTHHGEAGPLLKQAIDLALDALDAYLDNVLRPHSDAPRRLELEGDELRGHGTSTQEIAAAMAQLLEVEAWEGDAADSYRQAATVQHKATQELAGVMLSSGAALLRAADLNRVTFFLVAERLRMGRRNIELLSSLGLIGGQLYLRLRTAASQLRSVLRQIQEMVSSVQEGSAAQELASQLDALADLPNVLEPLSWPSGVERADREPADTGSAIVRE